MTTIDRTAAQAGNADLVSNGAASQDSTQDSAKQRMDAAFARLRAEHGFIAVQDFECCQTCAHAAIMDDAQDMGRNLDEVRSVFYSKQDADAWIGDDLADDLYLSHSGDASQVVVDVLRESGFEVFWSGEMTRRIGVVKTLLI